MWWKADQTVAIALQLCARAATPHRSMAAPVTVQNTQKAVRVCERTLAEHAGLLRKILGVDDYALVRYQHLSPCRTRAGRRCEKRASGKGRPIKHIYTGKV